MLGAVSVLKLNDYRVIKIHFCLTENTFHIYYKDESFKSV